MPSKKNGETHALLSGGSAPLMVASADLYSATDTVVDVAKEPIFQQQAPVTRVVVADVEDGDSDDDGDRSSCRSRALTENTIIDETNDGFALIRVGSVSAGAINLAQAALGAGTLAMPLALQSSGTGLGIVLLLIIGVVTVFDLRLLMEVAHKHHVHTYEDVALKATNNRGWKWLITMLTCGLYLGVTVVYVITVGDILMPLLQSRSDFFDKEHPNHRRLVIFAFWLCFMLPLSLLRDITTLRYPSLFAVVALLFLIVSMVIFALTEDVNWSENVKLAQFDISMVDALPTMFFAFCCQCNAFEIYHEMRPGTPGRVARASARAITLAAFIYLTAGVMGVAAFGAATNGNILTNYNPTDHVYMTIAFLGFAFTITFSFPVCVFPMRDTILQALGWGNAYTASTVKRCAVAGMIAVVAVTIGLFVTSIIVVFSLVGSVCCSTLAFTLPGYFAIRDNIVTRHTDDPRKRLRFYLACASIVLGIGAGGLGLGVSIYKLF